MISDYIMDGLLFVGAALCGLWFFAEYATLVARRRTRALTPEYATSAH